MGLNSGLTTHRTRLCKLEVHVVDASADASLQEGQQARQTRVHVVAAVVHQLRLQVETLDALSQPRQVTDAAIDIGRCVAVAKIHSKIQGKINGSVFLLSKHRRTGNVVRLKIVKILLWAEKTEDKTQRWFVLTG